MYIALFLVALSDESYVLRQLSKRCCVCVLLATQNQSAGQLLRNFVVISKS